MPPGNRRIQSLARIARLREVEKHKAALAVAQAQGMQGKLAALRDRSGELAASYSARRDAVSGADLACQLGFTAGIETIRDQTASETLKAQDTTRAAMARLRAAERRHDITGETLLAQRRAEEMQAQMRETAQLARKLKSHS